MSWDTKTLNDDYATALSLEMLFMTLTAKTKSNWLMSVMSLSCFLFIRHLLLHFMNESEAWSLRLTWIISREWNTSRRMKSAESLSVGSCLGSCFRFFVCLFATAYAPSSLGLCLHGASRQDSKIQFIRDGGDGGLALVDSWKMGGYRKGRRYFEQWIKIDEDDFFKSSSWSSTYLFIFLPLQSQNPLSSHHLFLYLSIT
jgi:hypothetical protein